MRRENKCSPALCALTTCVCTLSGIEDLREKREEILKQLREDDAEKAKIQQDLQLLTKRLAQVNDSIARKVKKSNYAFIQLSFLGVTEKNCHGILPCKLMGEFLIAPPCLHYFLPHVHSE